MTVLLVYQNQDANSITVSEHVYKIFFKVYEKIKRGLEIKGVRSFSGYLTSIT